MLTVFPSLSWMQELSPLLIRIVLAVVLIHWSYRRLMGKNENAAQNSTKSKVVGIIDGILGVMFLIGAWTQVAAIILAIDLVVRIVKKAMSGKLLTDGVNYYLILLVLCISLIVTSAGWLALDLGV